MIMAKKYKIQRKPKIRLGTNSKGDSKHRTSNVNISMMRLIHNGEPLADSYAHVVVTYNKQKGCLVLTPIDKKIVAVVNVSTRHWGMDAVISRMEKLHGVKIPNGVYLEGEWNDVSECMEVDISKFVAESESVKVVDKETKTDAVGT